LCRRASGDSAATAGAPAPLEEVEQELSSLPLGVVTTGAVPDDGRACRVLPFFSFFSRREARLSSLRSSRLTEEPSAESRCMCVEGAGGFRRAAEGPALPLTLR
jgi:hypothetical protein